MEANHDFYNDFTQNFMGAYGYSEYLEKRLLSELAKNKEFEETKEKLDWMLHEFNDQNSVEQIFVAFREIENKYIP
jgi:hypothetical protein